MTAHDEVKRAVTPFVSELSTYWCDGITNFPCKPGACRCGEVRDRMTNTIFDALEKAGFVIVKKTS